MSATRTRCLPTGFPPITRARAITVMLAGLPAREPGVPVAVEPAAQIDVDKAERDGGHDEDDPRPRQGRENHHGDADEIGVDEHEDRDQRPDGGRSALAACDVRRIVRLHDRRCYRNTPSGTC